MSFTIKILLYVLKQSAPFSTYNFHLNLEKEVKKFGIRLIFGVTCWSYNICTRIVGEVQFSDIFVLTLKYGIFDSNSYLSLHIFIMKMMEF